MKNKSLIIISLVALMSFSLIGCGDKKPAEPSSTETESIETTETTSTESTELIETTESIDESVMTEENSESITNASDIDEKYEGVFFIKSIEADGVYLTPYNGDDIILDYGSSFFVSKGNLSILKNGKTSLFDSLYFYDGCVVTFKGSINEKYSYSEIIPDEGEKIVINLIPEYKEVKESNNTNRDESEIDIIQSDKFKADVLFNGIWCKFYYPPEFDRIYTIKEVKNDKIITVIAERESYKAFELIREPVGDGNNISVGDVNDNKKCIYKTDSFCYFTKTFDQDKENKELINKALEQIEKTIIIIE